MYIYIYNCNSDSNNESSRNNKNNNSGAELWKRGSSAAVEELSQKKKGAAMVRGWAEVFALHTCLRHVLWRPGRLRRLRSEILRITSSARLRTADSPFVSS